MIAHVLLAIKTLWGWINSPVVDQYKDPYIIYKKLLHRSINGDIHNTIVRTIILIGNYFIGY